MTRTSSGAPRRRSFPIASQIHKTSVLYRGQLWQYIVEAIEQYSVGMAIQRAHQPASQIQFGFVIGKVFTFFLQLRQCNSGDLRCTWEFEIIQPIMLVWLVSLRVCASLLAKTSVYPLGHLKRRQVFINWNDFSIVFAHLRTGVAACAGCQAPADILSAPPRRHFVLFGWSLYAVSIHAEVRRWGDGGKRHELKQGCPAKTRRMTCRKYSRGKNKEDSQTSLGNKFLYTCRPMLVVSEKWHF
jgi:hypothetical protein